ncbi:MAG: hypothetical protein JJ966_07920 [Balneolaceae bacterium]|nr:hypothetical protein [Balneolaceae bacterium]
MKNFIYITTFLIICSIIAAPVYAQSESNTTELINSGSFITSINFGYLGAERDRNFNHEFEKSFKNISYDLQLSYFLTNTLALNTSISNIITSRNLYDFDSTEFFKINNSSIKLGLGAGYYHPIAFNKKASRLFFEGGVFRFSSSYDVSSYQGSFDKSFTGYTMATGLLMPLSSRILLNLSLKRDTYPEDYVIGTTENGVYTEINRETKWNSELNLNIGFSIKF